MTSQAAYRPPSAPTAAEQATVAPEPLSAGRRRPYLGAAAFREDDADLFFGRDDDRVELERLVRHNLVTVLFSASGLGKTSLLRAGLFPALCNEVFPIPLRIDPSNATRPLFGSLRDVVRKEAGRRHIELELADVPDTAAPRELFRGLYCWSRRQQLLEPLLVVDQFEELFQLDRQQRQRVIDELADLANPRDRTAHDVVAEAGRSGPRPRLLLSLREDYLAHLEDLKTSIPAIMRSRYRLLPMTGLQAKDAIVKPAPDLVSSQVADTIIQIVTKQARGDSPKPLDEIEVEPSLLSMFCLELDRLREEQDLPEITEKLTESSKDPIVKRFYDSGFEGLDHAAKLREFVEEELVIEPGRRTTIAVAAAERYGVTDADLRRLEQRRLVRIESRFNARHVELIHDLVVEVAFAGRAARKKKRVRLARERRRIVLLLVLAVAVFVAGYGFKQLAAMEEQRQQRAEFRDILVTQGREALLRDEIPTAVQLLDLAGEQGLPRNRAANIALGRALTLLGGVRQSVQHVPGVACLRLRSDAGRLLTCGSDGTARIWPLAERSGKPDKQAIQLPVPAFSDGVQPGPPQLIPSHAASWVLAITADGNATVVDEHSAQPALPVLRRPPSAGERAGWVGCISPDDAGFAIWSPRQPDTLRRWRKDPGDTSALKTEAPELAEATCLDGGGVLAVTASGDVIRFEPRKAGMRTLISRSAHGPAEHVAGTPDGSLVVATTTGSPRLQLWRAGDPESLDGFVGLAHVDRLAVGGNRLLAMAPGRLSSAGISPAASLPTDRYAALPAAAPGGDRPTLVAVWDLASHHLVFSVERLGADAILSPGGETLAIRSSHQIELWETAAWRLLLTRALDERSRPRFEVSRNREGAPTIAVADGAVARVIEPVSPGGTERRAGRAPERFGAWPVAAPTLFTPPWVAPHGPGEFSTTWPAVAPKLFSSPLVTTRNTPIMFSPDGPWAAATSAAGKGIDTALNLDTGEVVAVEPTDAPSREALGVWLSDRSVVVALGGRICRKPLAVAGAPRRVSCLGTATTPDASILVAHPREPRVLVARDDTAEWVSFATAKPSATPFILPPGPRALAMCITGEHQVVVARDDGSIVRTDGDGAATALPFTLPGVTALRGSPTGALVVAHAGGVDVIDPDDTRHHIDTPATDAALVEPPARVLWACDRDGCTAWDPDRRIMVAALRVAMAEPRLSGNARFLGTGSGLLLLPVPPRADDAVLRGAPVVAGALSEDGKVIAQNASRENELVAGGVTTRLPAAAGALAGPSFAAGAAKLVVPSGHTVKIGPHALALHDAWIATGTIAALAWNRARTRFVAVDTELAMAVIDPTSGSIVAQDPGTAQQSLGSLAVFDPDGQRFAVLVPAGEIQVHRTDGSAAVERYPAAAGDIRQLDLARSTVLAVTRDALLVWTAAGVPPVRLAGAFARARLAPDGAHLVALENRRALVWTLPLRARATPMQVAADRFDLDSTGTRLLVAIAHPPSQTDVEVRKLDDLLETVKVDAWTEPTTTALFIPGGQRVWMPGAHVIRAVDNKKQDLVLPAGETPCAFDGDGRHVILCDGHGAASYRAFGAEGAVGLPQTEPLGSPSADAAAQDGRSSARISTPSGDVLWIFDAHAAAPRKLQLRGREQFRFGADPDVGWSLADNGVVTQWNLRTGDATIRKPSVVAVALGARGARMVVASETLALTLSELDLTGDAPGAARPLAAVGPDVITAAAMDRTARWLVIGRASGMVQAFDLDAPAPPAPALLTGVSEARPTAIAVAMTGAGPAAAIGRVDGTVNLWRLGDRDDKHVLLGHVGAISSVALDDSGSWLATASADGTVRIWDAATQDCITRLTPRPDRMPATLVAFSPGDKPALLSASESGDLFVWALFSAIPSHAEIQSRLGPWQPLE